MTDASPFPELPPAPDDPGEYLTWFEGDVVGSLIDAKDGGLILKVKVTPTDKYRAMPLTDIRGRRFNWTVHARRGRKPLVAANGQAAIYAMRENREKRAAERAGGTKATAKPVKKKRRVTT